MIEYANRTGLLATAIECKFDEPFGGWAKHGLKPLYLEHAEFWTDLPNLREIAGQVSPDNNRFVNLDVPQLIKHILGLRAKYGQNGFRLLYLWYDVAGPEAIKHRLEIAEFVAIAAQDGIAFRSLTYQDVIFSLARSQREQCSPRVHRLSQWSVTFEQSTPKTGEALLTHLTDRSLLLVTSA